MKSVFLLQLDGVSFPVIEYALKKNLMPFTKTLLSKGWCKWEFFCGLPSTTPASQLNLLYGINDLIPAFRFLLKKEQKIFLPSDIEAVHYVEDIALKKNPHALFRDGATVFTIFSGGTAQSLSVGAINTKSRVFMRAISFLKNPFRTFIFFIKIVIFFIIERNEYNALESKDKIYKGKERYPHILKRMFEEIANGELALYFSKQMIEKQQKSIYVNFTGFDEIAHLYSPNSQFAQYYLSMLDLYIKECYKALEKSTQKYEFIILSDHGQVTSTPYIQVAGTSLANSIGKIFPKNKIYAADKPTYDDAKQSDLTVMVSGGLALVYNMQKEKKLSLTELEQYYPMFAQKISMLPGIGFVLGQDTGHGIVYVKGVKHTLSYEESARFLPYFEESVRKNVIYQLQKLLNMEWGADAYIFGGIEKDHCIGFETQRGAHGSIGGSQTTAFFMSKNVHIDTVHIQDFSDIYKVVSSFMHDDSVKSSPATTSGNKI